MKWVSIDEYGTRFTGCCSAISCQVWPYRRPCTEKGQTLDLFLHYIFFLIPVLTRRVLLVEQEQLTLPEHLCLPPVFSGVRVTRYLVLRVRFVDRLSVCLFSFWSLCCLFFDLRILVTPFVSSNSSSIEIYFWCLMRSNSTSRVDIIFPC
jgi:hypothetical protein